jgi:hypothetical protein
MSDATQQDTTTPSATPKVKALTLDDIEIVQPPTSPAVSSPVPVTGNNKKVAGSVVKIDDENGNTYTPTLMDDLTMPGRQLYSTTINFASGSHTITVYLDPSAGTLTKSRTFTVA